MEKELKHDQTNKNIMYIYDVLVKHKVQPSQQTQDS